MENKKIVGLCGSLRKGSYNAMLLKLAGTLLPQDVDFEIISFDDIPVYNADIDIPEVAERPESVVRFRNELAKASA
ncbi:MAG: NAD(P)H-dependent oxidoreductase, partial [Sphingobacteriales bacterium]